MAAPCNSCSSGFCSQGHLPYRHSFISGSFCPQSFLFYCLDFSYFFFLQPFFLSGLAFFKLLFPLHTLLNPSLCFAFASLSALSSFFVFQGAHPCPACLDEVSPLGQKFYPHTPLAASLLVLAGRVVFKYPLFAGIA